MWGGLNLVRIFKLVRPLDMAGGVLIMKKVLVFYLVPVCIFGFEKIEEEEEKTIRPLFQLKEEITFGEGFSMETEAIEDWDGNKNANISLKMFREIGDSGTFEVTGAGNFEKDLEGNDTGAYSLEARASWSW